MPKIPMDYSNTIFYKIYCIDPSINELYIGHTTNFVQRKHAHKQGCNNVKNASYNCKLYQAMRENNGWDNWKMDIIAFHECDNLLGAKIQEQKYYEEYKATLNSIEPLPKPKPKIVNDVHNTTRKHIKNSAIDNGEIKSPQISYKYYCNLCNYKCNKNSEYTKHISTNKHKILQNSTSIPIPCVKKTYSCSCGKVYKHSSTLYHHKNKCSMNQEQSSTNIIINNEPNEKNTTGVETDKELLIKMLLKNQEIMEKLIETMPNIGNNSHDLSSK